jgi:hypothetical protein
MDITPDPVMIEIVVMDDFKDGGLIYGVINMLLIYAIGGLILWYFW